MSENNYIKVSQSTAIIPMKEYLGLKEFRDNIEKGLTPVIYKGVKHFTNKKIVRNVITDCNKTQIKLRKEIEGLNERIESLNLDIGCERLDYESELERLKSIIRKLHSGSNRDIKNFKSGNIEVIVNGTTR